MLQLKLANTEDIREEYEALRKIPADENGLRNEYASMTEAEFREKGLPKILANIKGEELPEGYVPCSVYFLWDDDKIVGIFHFRHHLCESLKKHGGHIGYAVIKEYRGRGYATKGLKLLLDEICDRVPEDEIWLDAREDNLASQKVMLNNGAYKTGEYDEDGVKYIKMRIKNQSSMHKTFDFLKNRARVNGEPINFVSTIDGDRPSCRPFGDPVFYDGKLYALTMKSKSVSKQLAENNHACITAYDGEHWIRVNCQLVDDSKNTDAKRAVLAEFDWAEEAGYTLDNPDFQLFYFAKAESECRDSDGELIWKEEF